MSECPMCARAKAEGITEPVMAAKYFMAEHNVFINVVQERFGYEVTVEIANEVRHRMKDVRCTDD